jgi:hypothetical protein
MSREGALRSLPLVTWARRMQRGTFSLRGRLCEAFVADHPEFRIEIEAGEVAGEVEFEGGASPRISRVHLDGGVTVRTPSAMVGGGRVSLVGGALAIDDQRIVDGPLDGIGTLLGRMLDALADVSVVGWAEPSGDILLHLGYGLQASLPVGAPVRVQAAARGPADGLVLSEPLDIRFGSQGLRISNEQFRLLSRLAGATLSRVRLHPDGTVTVEGHASAMAVEIPLGGPLQRAGAKLSQLVRNSPKMTRYRRFLDASRSKPS